jgi:hypothetical protein
MGKWRIFTAALKAEWPALWPFYIIPEEGATGTHLIGGWMGPRASLDAMENSVSPSGNRTPDVQSVAIPTQLSQLEIGIG